MRKFLLAILIFSGMTYAQVFEWETQNPSVTGADFTSASILPNGNFVVTGDKATILISSNRGADWMYLRADQSGGYRNIYEAHFIDNNTGYAAGANGLLLKTTDGGINWMDLFGPVSSDLYYIYFTNANTGYAAGFGGVLLKTTDGGANWAQTAIGGTASVFKIFFTDANTGYLGTNSDTPGRLLKSTDAGATWNPMNAPGSGAVRGIYFFDDNTGFVSTAGGTIHKTTDGGGSWSTYNSGAASVYELDFRDVNNGAAVGSGGSIFYTSDGGAVWNSTAERFTDGTLFAVDFDVLDSVLAVGEGGAAALSANAGVSWNLLMPSATFEDIRSVFFTDANTGYAAGGASETGNMQSVLLKTTNGGEEWALLAFDAGSRLYAQYWTDANTGWVVTTGADGFYKTTDGGASFTAAGPGQGVPGNVWTDIKFAADGMTGYAVNNGSYLIKTTNGGGSWTVLSDPFATGIYALHLFDASNFIAAGQQGRIYKSTDGGATFTNISPASASVTVYSVYFLDQMNGYAADSSGFIYKTTNGGTSWGTYFTGTSGQLRDIKFASSTAGWAAGENGLVVYTTDGGTSWNRSAKFPHANTVYKMAMAGGRLWMGAASGSIVRGYSDPAVPVELTMFTAAALEDGVRLEWQTATETNNRGFEIERRSSDRAWERIGFAEGAGTVTEIRRYSFTDREPLEGKAYYRLKQVDFDGSYEYSSAAEVEFCRVHSYELGQNYPNPFNPSTVIKFKVAEPGIVKLAVYNSLGEEAAVLADRFMEAGAYSVELNASSLPAGVYYYRISAAGFNAVRKMVLLK